MDHRVFGFPRGRRTDSPAARLRGDFPHSAFCNGEKRRLIRTGLSPFEVTREAGTTVLASGISQGEQKHLRQSVILHLSIQAHLVSGR